MARPPTARSMARLRAPHWAVGVALTAIILTAIAWPTHVASESLPPMPPIEAGIATAVALRGLRYQLEPFPTPPTTEPPPPPQGWPDIDGTPSDATWDRVAQCESNGRWDINTSNGYYGGLQFSLTSWRAVGGTGYPHQASRDEQIYRADRLWTIQGWGAWPGCAAKLGFEWE